MNNTKSRIPAAAWLYAAAALLQFLALLESIQILGHVFESPMLIPIYANYLIMIIFYAVLAMILFLRSRTVAAAFPHGLMFVISMISGSYRYGLAMFLTAAYLFCFTIPRLERFTSPLRKLWFVPAAVQLLINLSAVGQAFSNIASVFLDYFRLSLALQQLFSALLLLMKIFVPVIANLMLCRWISHAVKKGAGEAQPQEQTVRSSGYFSMAAHILLLLFSFGIWQYVWIYRVTDYTNGTPGEEYRNPANKLLLCMFVPFYYLYWVYKSARRIDTMASARGVSSDLSVLCTVLAVFIGIVPPILMQDTVNTIETTPPPYDWHR